MKSKPTGTPNRCSTLYFAPDWIEMPRFSKATSKAEAVFRAVKTSGDQGITRADLALALKLSVAEVGHGIVALQKGRRMSLVRRAPCWVTNREFAAKRMLYYLRWGDTVRAGAMLTWMQSQHPERKTIGSEILEALIRQTRDDALIVQGVIFNRETAYALARKSAACLTQLFEAHSIYAKSYASQAWICIQEGADVISLDGYRYRRAMQLYPSENDRIRALRMVLSTLRRKDG